MDAFEVRDLCRNEYSRVEEHPKFLSNSKLLVALAR